MKDLDESSITKKTIITKLIDSRKSRAMPVLEYEISELGYEEAKQFLVNLFNHWHPSLSNFYFVKLDKLKFLFF